MRKVLWPIALAQTIVWASTFYLFPALLPAFESDTGWSKTALTGAFTLSLLAIAVVAPISGRGVDRGYGGTMLIAGNVVAACGLTLLGFVEQLWQFYVAWLLIGIGMGTALYETCFAIITRAFGLDAKPLITRITLIAGFAGTVSFPVANFLAHNFGWRVAVFVAAGSLLLITIPLSLLALSNLRRHTPKIATKARQENTQAPTNNRAFWLIVIGFSLVTLSHTMMMTHLLPLLGERGVSATLAVTLASLIGPMQVAGRLVLMATENKTTTYISTLVCFGAMLLAVISINFAGGNLVLIVCFVVLHGAGWGTLSIMRPVLTREVLGAHGFGYNSGRISAFGWVGSTIAPLGGAMLWHLGGYTAMLAVCLALSALAIVAVWFLKPERA